MKKKIGMLYLCTGPYSMFWEDYYNTFEKKFLPNTEKFYYVFTDNKSNINTFNSDKIKIIYIDSLPWPLITLLRFNYFLMIEEELKEMDYLMFTNANMVCNQIINEKDILPRESKKEELFFVQHPGHYKKRKYNYPYDRNKKSLAYIPYNCGDMYVIGAIFGGKSNAFLRMSEKLKARIESDLKRNIIARWHDESHINRYIIKRNVRFLDPGFCYPVGFELQVEKRIQGVSKMAKFDVQKFKGNENNSIGLRNVFKKVILKIKTWGLISYLKDFFMMKKIDRIED